MDELEGEIDMLRDLIGGKLDDSKFTHENIDGKLATMFSHIRFGKLQEAKKAILNRKKL